MLQEALRPVIMKNLGVEVQVPSETDIPRSFDVAVLVNTRMIHKIETGTDFCNMAAGFPPGCLLRRGSK